MHQQRVESRSEPQQLIWFIIWRLSSLLNNIKYDSTDDVFELELSLAALAEQSYSFSCTKLSKIALI